jgi:hypothetical protein
VFAVAFIIALVLSVCMVFWRPRIYSSTARIEVQEDAPQIPGSDPYFMTTQLKIIKSYSMLTNVIATLHLGDKLAAQAGDAHWMMDQTYKALFYAISVKQTRLPNIIEITVRNHDPKLAADIANAIIDAYRDVRLERWRDLRLAPINALRAQLSKDETMLGAMETNLNEVRAKLEMSDLDEESDVKSSTLSPKAQPYFSLKRKIEELRRNNAELKRTIQRETAILWDEPQRNIVLVRDPARPILRPTHSMPEIFSRWMFGGTLAALVLGGVGTWLAHFSRQKS